jgi:acyl transferase domain-containing protein
MDPAPTSPGGPLEHGPATKQYIDGTNPDSAIAICGMALRLPSGIRTPQQLWQFLLEKRDARCRVPDHKYIVSEFYDSTGKPAHVNTEYGYFLDDDVSALDTSFFSMPRTETERMDPQQRMMLEVVRECFEDAGEADWRGKNIGCYMGTLGEDWLEMITRETQNWGQYRLSGYGDFALSNRVSYEYDLKGSRYVTSTRRKAGVSYLYFLACRYVQPAPPHSSVSTKPVMRS